MSEFTPGPWSILYDPDEEDRPLEIVLAHDHDHRIAFPTSNGNSANAHLIAAAPDLLEALLAAVRIADEAREEWDKAPSGMRAGKLLIALSGRLPGYRSDIDAVHAAIAKAIAK